MELQVKHDLNLVCHRRISKIQSKNQVTAKIQVNLASGYCMLIHCCKSTLEEAFIKRHDTFKNLKLLRANLTYFNI